MRRRADVWVANHPDWISTSSPNHPIPRVWGRRDWGEQLHCYILCKSQFGATSHIDLESSMIFFINRSANAMYWEQDYAHLTLWGGNDGAANWPQISAIHRKIKAIRVKNELPHRQTKVIRLLNDLTNFVYTHEAGQELPKYPKLKITNKIKAIQI